MDTLREDGGGEESWAPLGASPFLLSQGNSKAENQAFCQARGQEKVTMKINPIGV